MNINLSNKNTVFVLNLLFFVVLCLIVYFFIYSKTKDLFDERKVVYSRFYNINMQLEDFSKIQTKIDEQKDKINETIAMYEDCFMTNDEIISTYKLRVLSILNQSEITIDKDSVTQIQKDENNISLVLKFKASYEQVFKFLFEMEKFSAVSKISSNYLGETSVECSPVLYSAQVNDFFSGRTAQPVDDVMVKGYFKEISDKIFDIMDVGYIYTWRDVLPIPRNPFFEGFSVQKKSFYSRNVVAYRKLPTVILDGIMYEEKNPIVIIEGKLYTKGKMYKNMKIVRINTNTINVEYYGKIYTIKMLN